MNSSFSPSEQIEIKNIIRKLVFDKKNNKEISSKELVKGKLIRSGT